MKASYLGELMIQNRVKIRPAEIKDAEQIAILCEQLGYFATQQQIQQRLSQIQYNQAHVIYVATVENDYVIGWAHAHVCDLIVGPTQAILFGLVVDEGYRHGGIGRLLMHHIEQWAFLLSCQGVTIRSNFKRKDAHCFYEKIGYINIKQSLTFHKVLT